MGCGSQGDHGCIIGHKKKRTKEPVSELKRERHELEVVPQLVALLDGPLQQRAVASIAALSQGAKFCGLHKEPKSHLHKLQTEIPRLEAYAFTGGLRVSAGLRVSRACRIPRSPEN